MSGRENELAVELIKLTEQRVNAQSALLRWRIDGALTYMRTVTAPNTVTLNHIRRYLTGEYDDMPAMHPEEKPS